MDKDNKTQKVREILLKYTDPKGQYDGFNAWTIASMIIDAVGPEPAWYIDTESRLDSMMASVEKLDKMLTETLQGELKAKQALIDTRALLRLGKPSEAYAIIKEALE